jgi:hypothetical protein
MVAVRGDVVGDVMRTETRGASSKGTLVGGGVVAGFVGGAVVGGGVVAGFVGGVVVITVRDGTVVLEFRSAGGRVAVEVRTSVIRSAASTP